MIPYIHSSTDLGACWASPTQSAQQWHIARATLMEWAGRGEAVLHEHHLHQLALARAVSSESMATELLFHGRLARMDST